MSRNDLSTDRKINEILKIDLNSKKQLNERIMKSQIDMDQLNQQSEQNFTGKRVRQDLDTKKKVKPPNKVLKGIKDLLVITVVRQVIHQINVGVMERKNSMENATIAVSMVIRLMNAKKTKV